MSAAGGPLPGLASPIDPPDADPVKPTWRGWLHAVMTPVALVAGIVLVAVAPTRDGKIGSAVYGVALVALFGVSATYHRFTWSPRRRQVLKRLDHSMIFVFIAATYTPFCLTLLTGAGRDTVLIVVWAGALLGVALRMAFLRAPRWLYTPLYLALGWVAVFVLHPILQRGGVAALVLLIIGGLAYTLGAVAYASRRPDPAPEVFGYHEVFHAATVVAALCHYIAVVFAVFAAA